MVERLRPPGGRDVEPGQVSAGGAAIAGDVHPHQPIVGPVNPRLRALCDIAIPTAREQAGLHDYDGIVQDLSPGGMRAALSQLGRGPAESDPHDEAHLEAAERAARTELETLELHRVNPLYHIDNLDLAVYDRDYGPAADRAEARRKHVASWPDGVEAALAALDRVPAPVAAGLLGAARGLAVALNEPGPDGTTIPDAVTEPAQRAHGRLVAHLETAARNGDPDPALGAPALTRLLSDAEAMPVELGRLSILADTERDRLRAMLGDAAERYRPGSQPAALVAELGRDHPDPEGIYAEAGSLIDEVTRFTLEHDLVSFPAGECRVGPAPPSRRWALAMMAAAAPWEPDGPSWYYVSPPDPDWPEQEREEWLAVFSRTSLPAITVHEVTPGHFAHLRVLRAVTGEVRRTLASSAFIEGWAHYAEELFVEEGFRREDPRFTIGVAIEALIRVTRLAVSIGVHTGAMTVADATRRFEQDAFLKGPAAKAEAERATYDPTYGRYTWGKLEIRKLRDETQARWGRRYSHRRFHDALLALGAPPLGLIGDAVDQA